MNTQTRDKRTPLYFIGLRKEGKKIVLQATRTVDELSNEIVEYYGQRHVSKSVLRQNADKLLKALQGEAKFKDCVKLVVE